MPLGSYSSTAFTTATGVAVAANADIEVRREDTSALALIFSDRAGASAITQPGFQADSEGRFTFFAAGISGGYQVKVTKGAETFTARFQATGTARELDADPFWAGVLSAATKLAARIALKVMGLDGLSTRATNTILAAADSGKAFVATGTFTQTMTAAATLGSDWHVHYRVNAGQTVTFDPDAAELIDGAETKAVTGPASGYIVCDGSEFHTFGFDPSLAGQAEQEAGTDTTRAVTSGRQHFHPSAAKFWCKYDGTQPGPITPSADYNVTDVTDNGAGNQTVDIDTDFSGVDWAAAGVSSNPEMQTISFGVTGIQITTRGSGGTLLDAGVVSIVGFGDQ